MATDYYELLGVPRDDHELFHDCAVAIINVAADAENGIKASEALKAYPNVPYRLARRASLLTAAKSQLIVASVGIAVALAIAAWGLARHWHNGSSGARR